MERGFSSVEWLSQSNHRYTDGRSASSCPQPFPLSNQDTSNVSSEELQSQNQRLGHTTSEEGGVFVPGESSRSSSPSSLQEPEAWEGSVSETSHNLPGRARTKFSAAQLQELEESFLKQRYLGAGEKRRLSKVLKLSPLQIKTWFQNRRMKLKRQTQDARVEALFSNCCVPYYHYPAMSAPRCPSALEYNIASNPTGTLSPLHPPSLHPTWLMPPPPCTSLPRAMPRAPLLFSPTSAFTPYQSSGPENRHIQDYGRLTYQTHFPS